MSAGDNILIVEDEEEWSQAYKRAIDAVGGNHTVKVAKDLTTAEDLIGTTKFAVAFVDVGLDVADDRNVDGLSVMERIRATGDETSIIVVTGRSGQDLLPITRDAIQKYDAYYAVGKPTAEPADSGGCCREDLRSTARRSRRDPRTLRTRSGERPRR